MFIFHNSTASDSLMRMLSSSPHQSSSNSPSPTPFQESSTQAEVTDLLQLPCQASSPSFLTVEQKFVYCDSQRLSVTGDYTGGTGDSGVRDIHCYIPSDEALRRELNNSS